MNGRAAFAFECAQPRDLTVAISVTADASNSQLSLTVNGRKMNALPLHRDWNLACWKLNKNLIKPGTVRCRY